VRRAGVLSLKWKLGSICLRPGQKMKSPNRERTGTILEDLGVLSHKGPEVAHAASLECRKRWVINYPSTGLSKEVLELGRPLSLNAVEWPWGCCVLGS
jgi:hypothetical protein